MANKQALCVGMEMYFSTGSYMILQKTAKPHKISKIHYCVENKLKADL